MPPGKNGERSNSKFQDDKELAILLSASRLPLGHDFGTALGEVLEGRVDWERLLDLASRHAITPFLMAYLDQQPAETVPQGLLQTLQELVMASALKNLLLASELLAISRAFRSCGVEHFAYKGPAMAMSLFGSLDRRVSNDIDIVVPKRRLPQACTVLAELGFTDKSNLSPAQLAAAFRFGREHTFSHADIDVDLHWRLTETFVSPSLDEKGIWERTVETPFFGQTVPTPGPEDLLIALCLHAGAHEWMHLSLFCDIALLLARNPHLDWKIAWRHLGDSNTRRIVFVSLYLTGKHWNAAIPPALWAQISADADVLEIASCVETEKWPEVAAEPAKDDLFGWLLRRTRGARFWDRARYVSGITLIPTLIDFQTFRLPRPLIPLYPLLRGARLALKYGKRSVSRLPRPAVR